MVEASELFQQIVLASNMMLGFATHIAIKDTTVLGLSVGDLAVVIHQLIVGPLAEAAQEPASRRSSI